MSALTPDQLPTFIPLEAFTRRWDALGLTDQDLARLQWQIMTDPDAGAVVRGAAGLRKVRFAPPGRGKSGAYRVYYANRPGFGVVILAVVFAKSEAADLPAAVTRELAAEVAELERHLERRRVDNARSRTDQNGSR